MFTRGARAVAALLRSKQEQYKYAQTNYERDCVRKLLILFVAHPQGALVARSASGSGYSELKKNNSFLKLGCSCRVCHKGCPGHPVRHHVCSGQKCHYVVFNGAF